MSASISDKRSVQLWLSDLLLYLFRFCDVETRITLKRAAPNMPFHYPKINITCEVIPIVHRRLIQPVFKSREILNTYDRAYVITSRIHEDWTLVWSRFRLCRFVCDACGGLQTSVFTCNETDGRLARTPYNYVIWTKRMNGPPFDANNYLGTAGTSGCCAVG